MKRILCDFCGGDFVERQAPPQYIAICDAKTFGRIGVVELKLSLDELATVVDKRQDMCAQCLIGFILDVWPKPRGE